MSFTSAAIFAAPMLTAVVGTGTLYALHHLRSRPTPKIVETLLFWDPSDQHPTARSLWSNRLRQPLALLILSAIALGFSLALGLALWNVSHQPVATIVIDTGLSSADAAGSSLSPEILDAARPALTDGRARVIAAAEQPRVISDGNEPAAVASLQLAKLRPSQTAPASSLAIQLAAGMQGQRLDRIDWFTTQAAIPDDVPAVIASRVVRHGLKPVDRAKITSVSFTPSTDDASKGQLIVQTGGMSNMPDAAIQLTADDALVVSKSLVASGRENQATFENLKADGRRLSLDLIPAVGRAPIARTFFTLPRRSLPSFYGIQNAPLPLHDALLCLGSAVERPQGAIAVLSPEMPIPPGAVGAIIVVPDQGQMRKLPLIAQELPLTHGLGFQHDLLQVGFAKLPGETILLSAGDCPIVSLSTQGNSPVFYILASAITPDAPLPRLAAFPILINRICNNLTHTTPASPVVTSQRHIQDPLWNSPATVALVDTISEIAKPTDDSMHSYKSGGLDWSQLSLAAVIGLLLLEAFLFARKRIA
jgi:hypothetical protein